MSVFDGLSDSIKRRYLKTYQNMSEHWIEVTASTGNVCWNDSIGGFGISSRRSYTYDDVEPKHPDFVWCEWCGSKNHYRDLKCSSCGGTL